MAGHRGRSPLSAAALTGWDAALLEIEHQADHWDTPDHGDTGHLIAQALRAAVEIGRSGGLQCEHRGGSMTIGAPSAESGDVTVTRSPQAVPAPTDTSERSDPAA